MMTSLDEKLIQKQRGETKIAELSLNSRILKHQVQKIKPWVNNLFDRDKDLWACNEAFTYYLIHVPPKIPIK